MKLRVGGILATTKVTFIISFPTASNNVRNFCIKGEFRSFT